MIQSGSRIDLLEPTILLAGLTRRLRNVLDTAEILFNIFSFTPLNATLIV